VDSKWCGQNRHKEIDHLTDKIDIRKSIISRIERVTNLVPNLSDRTGHESCPKSLSQISRIERVTNRAPNLTDRTGHDCARPSVATRVLQHPWGQHDSAMPRSKEDDAARKREGRSARSADDAAARSADVAARKREDLLLRMALFNQARISR